MTSNSKLHNPTKSIGYFIFHCFLFSCISILTKKLMISGISIIQILFFQTFFACLFLFFFERNFFKPLPPKTRLFANFLRSLLWLIATGIFFLSLNSVPLPKAVALSFSTPLFTTILAVLILKESMKKNYIMAIICGFIGILIILRPNFEGSAFGSIMILFSCILWSCTDIIIKYLGQNEKNTTITWFYSFFCFILLLPILPFYWQNPTLDQIMTMVLIGFMSLLNITVLTHSYKIGNLTTIQPFAFFNLVFVSILSYFVFDEVVKLTTIIGSLVIIISSTFIAIKEHKSHKKLVSKLIAKDVI